HGVVQVANLVNQPVLLGLIGGKNAAVGSDSRKRHLLRFSITIEKRLAFIIGGWDFFLDDDLFGDFAFQFRPAFFDNPDELMIGLIHHVLPDFAFLRRHVMEHGAAVLDRAGFNRFHVHAVLIRQVGDVEKAGI